MKVRQHRGSLEESLKTTVEIDSTVQALVDHISATLVPPQPDLQTSDIIIHPAGFDERCGWNTYHVAVEGHGIFGQIDQFPDRLR